MNEYFIRWEFDNLAAPSAVEAAKTALDYIVNGTARVFQVSEEGNLDEHSWESVDVVDALPIPAHTAGREFTRQDFMDFFRREDFHELVTPDDCCEIFQSVLVGSSDVTPELLNDVINSYSAGANFTAIPA